MIFKTSIINIFLSSYAMWISYPLFEKYIVDRPNIRSSHKVTRPGGGGIVFVFVSVFSSLFFNFFIPLIVLPLALIGLIDDKFKLSSIKRFIVQIITSIFLIFYASNSIHLGISPILVAGFFLFLILLGTSIINFLNFVDGIDGLLAGSMLIILISISVIVDERYFLICGALIGFLKWNWSPAKIFMGDAGSTFLGAVLFSSIVSSGSFEKSFAILIISSPILLDPLTCLIRRFLLSEEIFRPHKKHLYQRLNQAEWSHQKISIIYMSSSLLLFISYLLGGIMSSLIFLSLIILLSIWLEKNIAIPFKDCF